MEPSRVLWLRCRRRPRPTLRWASYLGRRFQNLPAQQPGDLTQAGRWRPPSRWTAFPRAGCAVDRHHAGRKDHPAVPFIEFWPDDKIGDASLVLDVDKDDAFRRAGICRTSTRPAISSQRSSRACMASAPAAVNPLLASCRQPRPVISWSACRQGSRRI